MPEQQLRPVSCLKHCPGSHKELHFVDITVPTYIHTNTHIHTQAAAYTKKRNETAMNDLLFRNVHTDTATALAKRSTKQNGIILYHLTVKGFPDCHFLNEN